MGTIQNTALFALSLLVLGTMAFNIYLQGEINQTIGAQEIKISNFSAPTADVTNTNGGEPKVLSFEEFLPKGVPAIYGEELGVSFDKPVESLAVLKALDGDLYPNGTLKFDDLTEQQQQDYIKVGTSISCEYCCGVQYVTAPNGKPACGCAHSAAMRGLAMYLVINHRDEFTNDDILQELLYWKTMFFPKQMYAKALQLQVEGGSLDASVLDQIPDMVGGC